MPPVYYRIRISDDDSEIWTDGRARFRLLPYLGSWFGIPRETGSGIWLTEEEHERAAWEGLILTH